MGSPRYSGDGAAYVYGCSTTGSGSSLTAPGLIYSAYATGSESRFGHALAGFREFTGVYRHSYLAIGQPDYEAADGKRVGRVSVYEVGANMTFVAGYVPSVHDGQDDFGYALAVQQHQYTSSVPIDEGNMTYIGIGMPGAMVNGVRAGKVLIWRPLYAPGVASVVEATDPDASTDTRFGESIATLRPLQNSGGFVAGAPDAITPDGVQAGQVSTLQNDFGNAGWSTIRRNLDQETAGDQARRRIARPRSRNHAAAARLRCGRSRGVRRPRPSAVVLAVGRPQLDGGYAQPPPPAGGGRRSHRPRRAPTQSPGRDGP